MRLLLDTHIWIWVLSEPHRLSASVHKALQNAANELWLSPISIWEFLVLVEKKRLLLEMDAAAWVKRALVDLPVKEAALTREVALETGSIKLLHADPADRFLVATARVYELTLVTADKGLLSARNVRLLPHR